MKKIPEYPFPKNPSNNLTLFPLDLMEGKKVFHGTSSIYCDQIEENGFVRGWSPFEKNQGIEFIKMLSTLGMPDKIEDHDSSLVSINRYLENRNRSSLSFAFSGYEALFYATGLRRGGQIFIGIKNALNWIDQSDLKLNEEQKILYDNLNSKIQTIEESRGCIYLLDFEDQENVVFGNAINDIVGSFQAVFFNGNLVPASRIIGKMFMPHDYVLNNELLKASVTSTKIASKTRGSFIFELFSLFMGFNEEE